LSGIVTSESDQRAAYARSCADRVAECVVLWRELAARRSLTLAVGPGGLPKLEGRFEAIRVTIEGQGSPDLGYRTSARAEAKVAFAGRLRVRPPTWLDDALNGVRPRRFFDDGPLDARLVVRPSGALARTLLRDPLVMGTVRRLSQGRLDELSYANGAIAVIWAGVESDPTVLDEVLDLLAHIAVQGSETTPYR